MRSGLKIIILIIALIHIETSLINAQDTIQIFETNNEKWLVDQQDGTLYYLLVDRGNRISTCSGECLSDWIPVNGTINVSAPLNPNDFEIIIRQDGSSQIIYKGWPLYLYKNDTKKGDKNGVGGLWDIINPDKFPPD